MLLRKFVWHAKKVTLKNFNKKYGTSKQITAKF
jgi:hypothetical protein